MTGKNNGRAWDWGGERKASKSLSDRWAVGWVFFSPLFPFPPSISSSNRGSSHSGRRRWLRFWRASAIFPTQSTRGSHHQKSFSSLRPKIGAIFLQEFSSLPPPSKPHPQSLSLFQTEKRQKKREDLRSSSHFFFLLSFIPTSRATARKNLEGRDSVVCTLYYVVQLFSWECKAT